MLTCGVEYLVISVDGRYGEKSIHLAGDAAIFTLIFITA